MVRISFRPSWWQAWRNKVPGIDEFQMRALLLIRDRCEEWGFEGKGTSLDAEGLQVSVMILDEHIHTKKIAEFKRQLTGELEALPQFNSALCPCGCGSDLSIRECWRKRVRAMNGEVIIEAPAAAIRNQIFPEHKDHPLLGWARDGIRNVIVTACGCGQALNLPVRMEDQTVGHTIEDIGGPAGSVVYQAIRDSYDKVPGFRQSVELTTPPPMSPVEIAKQSSEFDKLTKILERHDDAGLREAEKEIRKRFDEVIAKTTRNKPIVWGKDKF